MPQLIVLGGLVAAAGYFFDKTGEGVDSASNGLLKVAVAGAAIYFVGRHFKWI